MPADTTYSITINYTESSSITTLTGTNWVLDKVLTITSGYGMFHIDFSSNGSDYGLIGIGVNPNTEGNKVNRLYYGLSGSSVYSGGWGDNSTPNRVDRPPPPRRCRVHRPINPIQSKTVHRVPLDYAPGQAEFGFIPPRFWDGDGFAAFLHGNAIA